MKDHVQDVSFDSGMLVRYKIRAKVTSFHALITVSSRRRAVVRWSVGRLGGLSKLKTKRVILTQKPSVENEGSVRRPSYIFASSV